MIRQLLGIREKGQILNIYNVQLFHFCDQFLLHDGAIYRIYTFCTSVALQIIEGNMQQAIAGYRASSSSA